MIQKNGMNTQLMKQIYYHLLIVTYLIDEIDIYNWEGFVNGPEDSPYEFYSY